MDHVKWQVKTSKGYTQLAPIKYVIKPTAEEDTQENHLWCELTLFIDWLNWFNFQFITDKGFMVISHQGIWSKIFYQNTFPQNVIFIAHAEWVIKLMSEFFVHILPH